MIGRMDHVGIAVPDLASAMARWRDVLGAQVGDALDLPGHGVRVAFARVPGGTVELIAPLTEDGPLAGFLGRHPDGAMHHLCFEVADLGAERARLEASGARAVGEPRVGAHGRPVLFLRPRDFDGTLIELLEAAPLERLARAPMSAAGGTP